MNTLSHIIEECIDLELNVAALYAIFHFSIPADAKFWWQMHQEERNHAALLRSINETFLPVEVFPDNLTLPSLEESKKMNAALAELLEKYRNHPPDRQEALLVALKIEYSAGEIHFQHFSAQESPTKVDKIFQELIREDKNHAERITKYMQNKGFQPETTMHSS